MKEALLDEGFELVDHDPDFVFIGLNKEMDYAGYSRMLGHLLNGAKLIGTNTDRILAKENGFEVGNGSVVALFEYATGQKSPQIAKPYAPILDLCLEHFGLDKEKYHPCGRQLGNRYCFGVQYGCRNVSCRNGCPSSGRRGAPGNLSDPRRSKFNGF